MNTRLKQRYHTKQNKDLVDIIDAIRDVLEAVHESVEAFLADTFKNLFTFLGSSPGSFKLISRLHRPQLHILQPVSHNRAATQRPHHSSLAQPVQRHVDFKLATLMFKSLHSCALSHLSDACKSAPEASRRLCSYGAITCVIPWSRTHLGDGSFDVAGPRLCNKLPASLR